MFADVYIVSIPMFLMLISRISRCIYTTTLERHVYILTIWLFYTL